MWQKKGGGNKITQGEEKALRRSWQIQPKEQRPGVSMRTLVSKPRRSLIVWVMLSDDKERLERLKTEKFPLCLIANKPLVI